MLLWTKRDWVAGYVSQRALKKEHFQPRPHPLLVNVYSYRLGLLAITSNIGSTSMAAFNEERQTKSQSFWVVGAKQSTMLAKSCLSNLFVIYTIQPGRSPQWQLFMYPKSSNAGHSDGPALRAFPEQTGTFSQPSAWHTNFTVSFRLLTECPPNGTSERTFHLQNTSRSSYLFSGNPGLLGYMQSWFWITGDKEGEKKLSPVF